MKKELGGQRLGNGNEMLVEIKEYDRSNQDLGFIVRTTMSAGTVVPVFCKVATPDDHWRIKCQMVVKTHPTEGPLFGSYKAEVQFFKAAVRLYQAEMYTDAVDQGLDMASVKLPQYSFYGRSVDGTTDLDNAQVNPSCIIKYLGISGIGISETNDEAREFNAIPLLMTWDVYKNYLANKQEKIGAVVHTPGTGLVETIDDIEVSIGGGPATTLAERPATGALFTLDTVFTNIITVNFTGADPLPDQIMVNILGLGLRPLSTFTTLYSSAAGVHNYGYTGALGTIQIDSWGYINVADPVTRMPKVVTFPLSNIDEMRRALLANITAPGSVFSLNSVSIYPYTYLFETDGGDIWNIMNSQEGLPIKTYMSDLFNNWLNTAWITGVGGINAVTAIDTTGNTFQIPQFILKKKIYDMLNNIAASGGSIVDWQEANWGKKPKAKATRPEYEGGLIKEIIFQEVVSNSATTGEATNQPLGTLAGKGAMGDKHVGGYIECEVDEISYIMAFAMITPRIDYSQGNEWDVHLKTMDDFHKPALDNIGFQDLIQERMAWWSTEFTGGNWVQKSAGKQPAWMEYRTSVNKCFGNFAIQDNEMFMTLNRRYEYEAGVGIKDMTTYIDPVKYNSVFSYQALDAQNFWVQIAFDVEVTRKITNRLMPNL